MGGDAVYPKSLQPELLKNVGDFYIDCERMPAAGDLKGHETEVIDKWLGKVQVIREQQTKLFDYLLTSIPRNLHSWRSRARTAPAIGSIPSRLSMWATTQASTTCASRPSPTST